MDSDVAIAEAPIIGEIRYGRKMAAMQIVFVRNGQGSTMWVWQEMASGFAHSIKKGFVGVLRVYKKRGGIPNPVSCCFQRGLGNSYTL